jgi:hypothetical protein
MWDAGQTTGVQYLGVVLECHLAEGRNIFRARKKRLSGEIKVRRKNLVHVEACVATRHLVSGIFGVHVWQERSTCGASDESSGWWAGTRPTSRH